MDLQILINQIAQLTERLNMIEALSKSTEEMPELSPWDDQALIRLSVSGSSYKKTLEDIVEFIQSDIDNILRVKTISLVGVTPDSNELAMVADAINALPQFTWGKNEIYSFVRITSTGFTTDPPSGAIGLLKQYYFIRNRASGVYGTGADIPVTPSDIVKGFSEIVPSEVIDYGDIGTDEVWEYGNTQTAVIIGTSTVFTAIQDSEDKTWIFIGESGLYGSGGNPFTEAMFFQLSDDEPPIVSTNDLPPLEKDNDTITLGDADLYRQLYCTEDDTTLTIPDAYADLNTSFWFRVYFAGSGEHSVIDDEATQTYYFKQGDFVLCEKKYGLNGWIVKKVGGTELEIIRAWISPYDEDLEEKQYPGFVVTPGTTMVRAWLVCTDIPTGDDVEVDMVNHTDSDTILASFTISANTNKSNVVTTFLDTVSEGDVIIFDCTQIGSSNPGTGLQLYLEITKP